MYPPPNNVSTAQPSAPPTQPVAMSTQTPSSNVESTQTQPAAASTKAQPANANPVPPAQADTAAEADESIKEESAGVAAKEVGGSVASKTPVESSQPSSAPVKSEKNADAAKIEADYAEVTAANDQSVPSATSEVKVEDTPLKDEPANCTTDASDAGGATVERETEAAIDEVENGSNKRRRIEETSS